MTDLILESEGERLLMVEGKGEEVERRCRMSKIKQEIYSASEWNLCKG